MTRLRLAALLAMLPLASLPAAPGVQAQACAQHWITGYVRGAHSPWTADGTSVWTRERIAAAGSAIPMGAYVQVIGVGSYRVADRGGGLGPTDIDILTDSVSEAYALTGWRVTCIYV